MTRPSFSELTGIRLPEPARRSFTLAETRSQAPPFDLAAAQERLEKARQDFQVWLAETDRRLRGWRAQQDQQQLNWRTAMTLRQETRS